MPAPHIVDHERGCSYLRQLGVWCHPNKSLAGEGGTAISGDTHVGSAGIVAGHNSLVKVNVADKRSTVRYEMLLISGP